MGYDDAQATLQGATKSANPGGDDGDEVPDQNKKSSKRRKKKSFLESIFGWIIDPITAIINGVVSIVMFVVNSIKFIINLPWCFKWYMFHMIGTILYLPISLIFLFFGMQSVEKKIFGVRNKMHDWIVCNTGYSILRYSDEIRQGCYFEKKPKRSCPSYTLPGSGGLGAIFSELFNELFSLSYISVVTSISFFLFFAFVFYYVLRPLLKDMYKSFTEMFSMGSSVSVKDMATMGTVAALFAGPALIPIILLSVVAIVLVVLWVIYAPKIVPKGMVKKGR